jgi:excisionase family DNA binding protein
VSGIDLHLDDEGVERLAAAIARRLIDAGSSNGSSSPWLNAQEAADYLGAPLSRVRKLTMTGELPCHRDGRRVLYRRDELDNYVVNGGAISP